MTEKHLKDASLLLYCCDCMADTFLLPGDKIACHKCGKSPLITWDGKSHYLGEKKCQK